MNGGAALRWLRAGTLLALGVWGVLVAMGRVISRFLLNESLDS